MSKVGCHRKVYQVAPFNSYSPVDLARDTIEKAAEALYLMDPIEM